MKNSSAVITVRVWRRVAHHGSMRVRSQGDGTTVVRSSILRKPQVSPQRRRRKEGEREPERCSKDLGPRASERYVRCLSPVTRVATSRGC
jgi:hypothetical protein